MDLIFERTNVPWLPATAILRCYRFSEYPPRELITNVFGLCFEGDKLLMVQHAGDRGWDIPGGHLEEGEDLVEGFKREVREEAAVELDGIEPFAVVEILLKEDPPGGYKYPTSKSYMICFRAKVSKVLPFHGEFETRSRGFFASENAKELKWVKSNFELYEAALHFPDLVYR